MYMYIYIYVCIYIYICIYIYMCMYISILYILVYIWYNMIYKHIFLICKKLTHRVLGIDCFMPANGETASIPVETKVSIQVSKSLLSKRRMADSDGIICLVWCY